MGLAPALGWCRATAAMRAIIRHMDTLDNYYAILGIPIDADDETLKHAYRQLARRYHPDLAGPEGALQMKRINRAYAVLSDPQKRLQYDTIFGGVIDIRQGSLTRPRSRPRRFDHVDDEFSGLSIFSTRGPFHTGPVLHTSLGIVSTLSSVRTISGQYIAAGTLDGTGILWSVGSSSSRELARFAADPTFTIESLRELRFSTSGRLLAGWGRLGFHVWNTSNGERLWSYSLLQRAVSAHYSIDAVLQETTGKEEIRLALPMLSEDPLAPRSQGVRASDIVSHTLGTPVDNLSPPLICAETEVTKREFWAIRLRALARDGRTLLTLSCAHTPGEEHETIIMRRWDLTSQTRFGKKPRPHITTSVLAGYCNDCTPPYAITPGVDSAAFVYAGSKVRLYDAVAGTYSELPCGTMGASSKLAISPDIRFVAVAREDSEVNEGVIDLWVTDRGQLVQKLYHPWQISALHFAGSQLIVALTDGTIQVWEESAP
jgi:WD40 repeat protein